MNVVQVTVNVHGSPSKGDHTGSQLVLEIFEMRNKKRLGVGSNFVHNSVILSKNELKLIVVHFELVFLEEDNLGALGNIDSNSGQALSLSDEGKDLRVKVHVEFVVLRVSDYESSLKSCLGFLDLVGPFLSPEVLK
jgi:hypothetical protein